MIFYTTNSMLTFLLILLIQACDIYILLAVLRLALGWDKQSALQSALIRVVDPLPIKVRNWMTQTNDKPPGFTSWAIVISGMLFFRFFLYDFVTST